MPDTPSTPMVTVSAFEWENLKREWDNLKREETLRTLEARLSERFHRRFWVLLTVGMILSIGGVQTIAFLLISARLMGGPVSYAQVEVPSSSQAAARRPDEQALAGRQMSALTEKIDQLNEKISSLETDNANMRIRLERNAPIAAREPEPVRRPGATASLPPPPPPAARELPRTASLPPTSVAPGAPPREGDRAPFRLSTDYELRLVVFGKTEATKIPPIQDYFKKMGYKVVADATPDPKSPYPTRQDFVFISYRKGAKPEAQRVEKFLRQEFQIQTVLAQYDVGDKLAGDIQIAFQEARSGR
jgi:hypothetical protein